MERNKSSQGRGGKSKTPQYPADLIALGSKTARSDTSDSKRSHTKPLSGQERKREATGVLPSMVPTKKAKITPGVRSSGGPSSGGAEAWEMVAIDCESSELVAFVNQAYHLDEGDKIVGLLCGAIRAVRTQRWKPEPAIVSGLVYLTKVYPVLFRGDCVTHALCSLLRRDPNRKGWAVAQILAAGLLLRGYKDKTQWPDTFLKLYVEDALGDRTWVDSEECSCFVRNIMTSVNTRTPPRSLLQPEMVAANPAQQPDEDEAIQDILAILGDNVDVSVIPRYGSSQEAVEQIVMDAVRDQLNRRQAAESITRNFLRFFSACCGLVEVRLAAASRLELWLQNPKLTRPAQELLTSVCVNCCTHNHRDIELISHLVKVRLKTKALINLYLASIREMLQGHPDNLATVMKHVIYNELSTSRNPNNMALVVVLFQSSPDSAPAYLADVFQDLLLNRDDYLRPLRALLREVVRVLRHDMNLLGFCYALMLDRRESSQAFRDYEFKERMFGSIADLIALSVFLAVSPAVREAVALMARGDKREIETLQAYQKQVAHIQRDSVWWLHETVPRMYHPTSTDFTRALHKVLFMEHAEQYYNKDMWPPENERSLLLRLASEVPVMQNTLARILVMGLSKEHPLSAPDTLGLVDHLVKRAAALPQEGLPLLEATDLEIFDLVYNLSAYRHPDNINLPEGYNPPQLAVSNLYWTACVVLLILAAHNPESFGSIAWDKYPMLRTFMEMCITNHFTYPSPTLAGGELAEETRSKELQMAALEKQQILEFEFHLAKKHITEQTSLLLSQLITMDPTGPPRKPPQAVLDQLRTLNGTHRMGHLLCRSRHPDFLLDIIQRQGASQSMPWLADLVESSEGALSHLPVQCLCEFLLSSSERQDKYQQLLAHLQGVLTDPSQDPQAPCEVLEYFLRRLGSPQAASRTQAIKGLKLVLSSVPMEDEPMDVDQSDPSLDSSWLLRRLPQLPHFPSVRPQLVQALRLACLVENEPTLVSNYICFLALHTAQDSLAQLTELVLDMAQLIVERSSIVAAILPSPDQVVATATNTVHALMLMFCCYLQKAREPRKQEYTWSESQDQILVTWSTSEECTMHILVVHAMLILMTYGPGQDPDLFHYLQEVWFPEGREPPRAYLVDTSEPALLIPDWVKLKMIRSQVDRIVDAALQGLEPQQLILFIQSFGIPVRSMSKLLLKIDEAVSCNPLCVTELVLDRGYMAQLVEVQHRRGALWGQGLLQVLELDPPGPEPEPMRPQHSKRTIMLLGSSKARRLTAPHQVDSVLGMLFGPHGEGTHEAFRTLQITLSSELLKPGVDRPVFSAVLGHLGPLLDSSQGADFARVLADNPRYSCPLLRLLTSAQDLPPGAMVSLTAACHIVLGHLKASKSSLVGIARHFLDTQQPLPAKTVKTQASGEACKDNTVELIARHLLQDSTEDRVGLLIDRLASAEPELIGSCPQLQMELLFSKSEPGATKTCRPYLLTLLTHRASWTTLYGCLQHLLASCHSNYDPTAVLDFLWALTCNPKLWQGREKVTPKHHSPEDMLGLDHKQLLTLLDYMMEEAVRLSEEKGSQSAQDNTEARLPLLLQSSSLTHQMSAMCAHLTLPRQGVRAEVARQLFLQLYLRIPGLIRHLSDVGASLRKAPTTEWSSSVLDKMSHTLLTALTATPHVKDWSRRSQDYELAARKMASAHPLLVLRQMPMLASSLRGRVHLDFGVFRCRNHLQLFLQVLGLLELLQPHIFLPEYSGGLEDILHSYFSLLKYHGPMKELVTVVNRLVSLLQRFIAHDTQRSLKYLQRHAHILNDVQMQHPGLSSVRELLSGLSLSRTDEEGAEVLVAVCGPQAPRVASPQWSPLLTALSKHQGEEVYSALQELDHLSCRRPSVLTGFVEPLCELLASPTGSVRSLAHALLARTLRHNPSTPVDSFVRCLDSDRAEVLHSALDNLPELVVCAQEHALPILQKVFNLGMMSNINTVSQISNTIMMLNLQTGC